MKDAMLRLKSAVKIVFNKTQFESRIESIRQDNEDLRALVSYLTTAKPLQSRCSKQDGLPYVLKITRSTCLALHESLKDCWSCSNSTHTEHSAKLCLASQKESSLRLDLALSCAVDSNITHREPSMEMSPSPLWLYVRTFTDNAWLSCVDRLGSIESRHSASSTERPRKRIKVEVSQDSVTMQENLRRSPSLCDSLTQCRCVEQNESCLGFLEAPRTPGGSLTQVFYHDCNQQPSLQACTNEASLADAIARNQNTIAMEDLLKIAHRLAISVLTLHATPWLRDQWRTCDISTFGDPSLNNKSMLETLHVTTIISNRQQVLH